MLPVPARPGFSLHTDILCKTLRHTSLPGRCGWRELTTGFLLSSAESGSPFSRAWKPARSLRRQLSSFWSGESSGLQAAAGALGAGAAQLAGPAPTLVPQGDPAALP